MVSYDQEYQACGELFENCSSGVVSGAYTEFYLEVKTDDEAGEINGMDGMVNVLTR